jgi:hypothetical protein
MTNPTTFFNWQMPENTSLVTDLPADFEVFGQAVDTDFQDLLGGTTGQVLSKTSGTDLDFTWVDPTAGDITGVTAGTGISGGGTSGTVTVTNSMATAIDAKGDLIAGTADDTFSALSVGADGTILTADSTEATGLKWAAAGSSFPASDTATVNTSETTSSTSYTDLTTPGPAVTVTTGTKALVIVTSRLWNQTADYVAMMSFAVSGATSLSASNDNAAYARRGTDTVINRFSTATLITGLTAGSNTFTAKYRADIAGTAAFRERQIFVMNLA